MDFRANYFLGIFSENDLNFSTNESWKNTKSPFVTGWIYDNVLWDYRAAKQSPWGSCTYFLKAKLDELVIELW